MTTLLGFAAYVLARLSLRFRRATELVNKSAKAAYTVAQLRACGHGGNVFADFGKAWRAVD